MKKVLIAVAALIPLAGCGSATNDMAQDNAIESHEANADYYQDAAENAANATVARQDEAASAMEGNSAGLAENGN